MQQPPIPQKLAAANTAFAEGKLDEAVGLIMAALAEQPGLPVKVHHVLLTNLMRLQRLDDGVIWSARALESWPDDIEIHNFNGIFLNLSGRPGEALAAFDRLLALQPGHRGALINKGMLLNAQGDGASAEVIFRTLLADEPASPLLHRALGKAFAAQRAFEDAERSLRQAISLAPADVDAWLDLSALVATRDSPVHAIALLDEAIAATGGAELLCEGKAVMFRRAGLNDRLEPYLEELAPRFGETAWFHHELGMMLSHRDRHAANDHFRRAVAIAPGNTVCALALVNSLCRTRGIDEGRYLDEAHDILKSLPIAAQRSVSKIAVETYLMAADYDGLERLGSFEQLGRHWASIDQQTALLLQMPRVSDKASKLELLHQHRSWGEIVERRAARHPIIHRDRAPRSRIRIGFMSSDLREHPVTYFAWPLFEHVERDRFEIYCYSYLRAAEPTPLQARLTEMVDVFRWHPSISDREAAQMIADDQIDILFELGGATDMNKIEVMAWKPAPLCASWLGYPHSVGLSTIDHLLVDPFLNPPDPALLIEQPLVMPKSWIVMTDRAFAASHAITPVSAVDRNGFVTFGTANNPYKYNVPMLRTWSEVLARTPRSRFLFVRPEAGSTSFQRNIRARFEAEGVDGDRIEFRAVRGDHMRHYNDIDIALDTFPQTGGTTTCEALWMGVPTITMVGEALFERLSYSILCNAGLGDLCATNTHQFVDIAIALAADTDRLRALRRGLRDQIRANPLGQSEQFARDFYDLVARTVAASAGTAALS